MNEPVVVVGCGGLGREVVSFLFDDPETWSCVGSVDDGPTDLNLARLRRAGGSLLGGLDQVAQHPTASVVVAIGDPAVRREIVDRLPRSTRWATVVSRHATVGTDVSIGEGSIIAPGVRVTCNIVIGRHVQIDQNSTVAHDVTVADFARISPQVSLTGDVSIGAGALVGAGATVLPGVRIGSGAVVGAGAVVVRDVEPRVVVKGVPAR